MDMATPSKPPRQRIAPAPRANTGRCTIGCQTALTPEDLLKYGEAIGLDKPVLQQCLESGKYDALIRKMKTQGENAGVRGTPTLMVGLVEPNSTSVKVVKIVVGTQPFAAFKEAIDGALAWAGK